MNQAKRSVRTALSLSFVRSFISLVCNVASIMIVSRILTPTEVGVFSVAVAFVTLLHTLREFGTTQMIVQERDLSPAVVRTVFTVNVILAWLLAAVLFACSNLIGQFYGTPGVAEVTRVLSLVFVLMPFGTTTMAYMRREMDFSLLVRINLVEVVVRSGSTVALAWWGFSYMSMAWASVLAMAVAVIGCMVWGQPYRIRGVSLAQWKRVLHFGTNRTVADIAKQVGEQSANIVIGRMFGMAPAGFYSRGYGVVRLFRLKVISVVASVAFPAYAREHRQGNAAPWLFRQSLVYITAVSWPFFAFSALMAYPLIRIAFGNQWEAAVPLMRWLCGAAIVGTLVYQCDGMLTALGRYREVTRVEVQFQLVRIALTVLAALHSVETVAAVQVAAYALAVILYYRKLVTYEALRLRALCAALLPSAVLTVATSVVPAMVLVLWPGRPAEHYVPAFLVAAGGAGSTWLAGVFVLKHPLSLEIRSGMSMVHARMRRAPKAG